MTRLRRRISRLFGHRPAPPQNLIPKLDATLQMLDEVRALILERQAAIRKTA